MTRLLTKKQVCEKIGFSRAHVDRLRNDEKYADLAFPKPVRIGFKVLWCETEVENWILTQLAKR